jgi:hypothetical protein
VIHLADTMNCAARHSCRKTASRWAQMDSGYRAKCILGIMADGRVAAVIWGEDEEVIVVVEGVGFTATITIPTLIPTTIRIITLDIMPTIIVATIPIIILDIIQTMAQIITRALVNSVR